MLEIFALTRPAVLPLDSEEVECVQEASFSFRMRPSNPCHRADLSLAV